MTTRTVETEKKPLALDEFVLADAWPGPRKPEAVEVGAPRGGFTGRSHNAGCLFPPGTKRRVGELPHDYSICIYLKAAEDLARDKVCVPVSKTLRFQVTNDPKKCADLSTKLLAIPLAAVKKDRWGWFWCGGKHPSFVGKKKGKD